MFPILCFCPRDGRVTRMESFNGDFSFCHLSVFAIHLTYCSEVGLIPNGGPLNLVAASTQPSLAKPNHFVRSIKMGTVWHDGDAHPFFFSFLQKTLTTATLFNVNLIGAGQ